jgi:predicted NBD/HSP70 family sugar kinase
MFGARRFIRSFAYLSFNYGSGGGIVSDGELLHGGNSNAGSSPACSTALKLFEDPLCSI